MLSRNLCDYTLEKKPGIVLIVKRLHIAALEKEEYLEIIKNINCKKNLQFIPPINFEHPIFLESCYSELPLHAIVLAQNGQRFF